MTQCILRRTRAIGHRQWLTTETPLRFIPITDHREACLPASDGAALSLPKGSAALTSQVRS